MITLIEQLLEEQRDLTAVERFSQWHTSAEHPAQQKYYSNLLPVAAPATGQQYGFHVDLDKCSGCKACVTACHSLNGLDDTETWRDVGLLIGGTAELPIMQHVTTACHHCLEPACASACPVNAYEKNPITGIVKHLDDQCFGCQYCTLACPYDVPKYNAAKGIVRKCDMCSDRLAVGEAPACVQACPHEAISIRLVNVNEAAEATASKDLVPSAPKSNFTKPTTEYSSRTLIPEALHSADHHTVTPQHAHWPLAIMLVLTQLSVGMFATGLLIDALAGADARTPLLRCIHATVALTLGLLALGASTCHLGRPQYAFRAFIGLRHSWLSREIVVFGGFAGAAVSYTVMNWLPVALEWLPVAPSWLPVAPAGMVTAAGWATVAMGLLGVFCSVMIYVFTRREFWSFRQTATKFVLTIPILGIAASWLTMVVFAAMNADVSTHSLVAVGGPWFAAALMISSLIKLSFEASLFSHLQNNAFTQLKRSATLMMFNLRTATAARFVAGTIGGIVMPVVAAFTGAGILTLSAAIFTGVCCLAGEMLERYLFFTAVSPDKMPGGLRS